MVGLAALSLLFLLGQASSAQQRMTDKDIESTMKNLKEDAKRFQSSFKSSLSKSTIRNTSQQKDANGLAKSFETQSETMLKVFQNSKKADTTLPGVLTSADQLDVVMKTVMLDGITTARWAKCKSELGLLATAFNMPYAGT